MLLAQCLEPLLWMRLHPTLSALSAGQGADGRNGRLTLFRHLILQLHDDGAALQWTLLYIAPAQCRTPWNKDCVSEAMQRL
mmetsp:Transcript_33450/g.92610  ORF Transcript_33450/g.92610 Transcript_33450/m.92610 type:complete len:81 (+) Transcript_33450:397-639(+)